MAASQAVALDAQGLARRRLVAEAFAPHGLLAGKVPGFTARPSQLEMALAVFDTIAERGTLVAEAGTGTGKTFAYLVPSLLAGGKTLISVGSKTLQDQVFEKDLRLVSEALGLDADLALLKGRQNYVCLHRMERSAEQALLPNRQAVAQLQQIQRFARTTDSGDRAQLASVPENASIWQDVTSTQDNCLGAECPRFDDCFVYKARRRALAADVVVVNHHLFLADMVLRDDQFGELLPAVDTVVLDEAHHLPRIGAEFFGQSWSLAQVSDLATDARIAALKAARDGAAWLDLTRNIERCAQDVRLTLAECGLQAGGRMALERLPDRAGLTSAVGRLDRSFAGLEAAVRANSGRDPDLDAIVPRVERLRARFADWLADPDEAHSDAEQQEVVRWVAASTHGAQFQATPLSTAASFLRARERSSQAWILTSATLTVAGRFDAFLGEIGLEATTRRWDSPFDYGHQALLYLPDPMPSPVSSQFAEQVVDAAWPLIRANAGRAFVLCSTLRAVDRICSLLRERIDETGEALELLAQGQGTRSRLLQSFRDSGRAVLVGSVSFWEGIDVRGQALSLVVIDKLPFAPPDDPLVEAKVRSLKGQGLNPFTLFQLPHAVTLLKQGAGRLIRDERDRGVLMVLDGRLLSKSYGKVVLDSLPPFRITRDQSAACQFLSEA